MSGSLRQKSPGVWEVRSETGRDPVTGRRRQKSRSVHGSKRDAQVVLNALVVEADSGSFIGRSTTFEQLCDRWLDQTENDLSPTTLRRYKNLLSKRILPALGDRPIHGIRTIDLDRLYLGLANDVGLAPATVRQVHSVIRRAFRQAVRWGWIASNPAINASPPRLVKADLSPPNVDQVAMILEAARAVDPDLARFLHIALRPEHAAAKSVHFAGAILIPPPKRSRLKDQSSRFQVASRRRIRRRTQTVE
jgi:integrase